MGEKLTMPPLNTPTSVARKIKKMAKLLKDEPQDSWPGLIAVWLQHELLIEQTSDFEELRQTIKQAHLSIATEQVLKQRRAKKPPEAPKDGPLAFPQRKSPLKIAAKKF